MPTCVYLCGRVTSANNSIHITVVKHYMYKQI